MLRNTTLVAVVSVLLASASSSRADSISIADKVLNDGLTTQGYVPAGTTSPTAQINYVGFIDTTSDYPFTAVQYDNAGNTINVSNRVVHNAPERGAVQEINVDGYGAGQGGPIGGTQIPGNYNVYLAGQPSTTNDSGFGAHANWVVTLNLDAIRNADFGGYSGAFYLSGLFGAWGNIGDTSGGVIQGEVLLNGNRIDNMGLTSYSSSGNQAFDLYIPAGNDQELSFLILNNGSNSLWNDGIFENVELSTAPEPSELISLSLGLAAACCLLFIRRRRKK